MQKMTGCSSHFFCCPQPDAPHWRWFIRPSCITSFIVHWPELFKWHHFFGGKLTREFFNGDLFQLYWKSCKFPRVTIVSKRTKEKLHQEKVTLTVAFIVVIITGHDSNALILKLSGCKNPVGI